MARNYRQGIYEVKNKERYVGKKNPRFLSSFEYEVFQFYDNHRDVIKWGAEVVVIPYYNPSKRHLKTGEPKKSRYIVDLYVKYYDRNGDIQEELIEIKPYAQTLEPKKGKNQKQRNYDEQLLTYHQNLAKWEEATKFAEERGMKFRLLTENEIFR